MSRFRVEARYTGPGPRQGVWLRASAQGFLSTDNFPDAGAAKREIRRLKLHPRFFRTKTDWQLRALEVSVKQKPEPKPAPVEPEPIEPPKPKKAKKKKKKPIAPKPVEADEEGELW